MKIFDLHADIGFDVQNRRKHGLKNILDIYHVKKFRAGDIQYVSMACYFEGNENWDDMKAMVLALKEEIALCEDIDLVLNKADLALENGHIKAILSIEGMCGITEDVCEKIDWLYAQGIRIASFCWNEENALASGVRGNPKHGLSEKGIQTLSKMEELNMIVDISHANEKTVEDIMSHAKGIVIASHSNARALCNHPRNLWDDQLQQIKAQQGIVGVVSAPGFVSTDKALQTTAELVKHIAYLKELIGIHHICIGFDFMDFYNGFDLVYTKGLKDCSMAQSIIMEMEKQGFSKHEQALVAYKNAIKLLNSVL